MHYDPQTIEKKWQQFWKKNKSFKASEEKNKSKYYVLDMFPYPSGSGLHVGHLVGYTATDVITRYKISRGFSVLHPMGWDSFGLPAEQYAIRTGTHPAITTKVNIKNFKEQLESVGFAYDWDREIMTSSTKYYKWTQWIFTKLYEKGLAYQADMLVNWCPALNTVLANEEVENGLSKEGGYPVERKPLRQWILKITEYADRLLNDLEMLDWPEGLKRLQRNWIGKSEGATISFAIDGCDKKIEVFTTCPHTIFGVTCIILSPEHPLVDVVTTRGALEDIKAYKKKTSSKSDLERTELSKVKTGVFTGGYAVHPLTNKRLPIWIADYVLMGYGSGAIMVVPAHDERDREFATQFSLPIINVIGDDQKMINSSSDALDINNLSEQEAKSKTIKWIENSGIGRGSTNYKIRDWLFSRQRYWGEPFPILHMESGKIRILQLDELPLELPEIKEYKPTHHSEGPLATATDWVNIVDKKSGLPAKRETHTMPQWAGSCWYYLRFCDPNNDSEAWSHDKEQYWMPVDLYVGGVEHAVLHLLYARFWHKVLYDCGLVSTAEPFKKLVNQGLIVARAYQKFGGGYVHPNEVVEREGEYYHFESGEKLRSQIEKMSKSKLNGVSPDEIIEEFGADALRLYVMFMGPIDKEKLWNTQSVSGCRRFLNRFFDMATSSKLTDDHIEEGIKLAHQLVFGVSEDIEMLMFNTAISKMMEFVNGFTQLSAYPKTAVKMAIQVLNPFAPHLAEELWERLGEKSAISNVPWPSVDKKYLVQDQVTYVVQVNGKLRGHFLLPKDQNQDTIVSLAKSDERIAKYLTGEIKKIVFVPNKLLNFVVA